MLFVRTINYNFPDTMIVVAMVEEDVMMTEVEMGKLNRVKNNCSWSRMELLILPNLYCPKIVS